MQKEIIVITSSIKQGAGTKTWLRERLTPSAWVRMMGEGLISDYSSKMDVLREVDDNIHEWTKDFGFIVKELKNALAASRIVDIGTLLKDLNDRLNKVSLEGGKIKEVADEALHEFDKDHEYLKSAGLFDDLKRKWVSNKLQTEKRKLRGKALKSVIDHADTIVKGINNQLNLMSKARAGGDIGKYIDGLNKISILQEKFQSKFFPIYNEYLKSIVDEVFERKNLNQPDISVNYKREESNYPSSSQYNFSASPLSEEKINTSKQNIENLDKKYDIEVEDQDTPIDLVRKKDYDVEDFPVVEMTPEEQEAAALSTKPTSEEEQQMLESIKNQEVDEEDTFVEEDKSKQAIQKFLIKKEHNKFLNSLAKVAQADPNEAVHLMIRYAKKIEKIDSEGSWKLMAVAEGFLE